MVRGVVDCVKIVGEILLTKNLCEPLVIVYIVLLGHFSKHAFDNLLVFIFFNFFDRKFAAQKPAVGQTHKRALPGVVDLGSQTHFYSIASQ